MRSHGTPVGMFHAKLLWNIPWEISPHGSLLYIMGPHGIVGYPIEYSDGKSMGNRYGLIGYIPPGIYRVSLRKAPSGDMYLGLIPVPWKIS